MKGFYAELKNDVYDYGITTKGLSFKELSCLLSCLKIIEQELMNHINSIQPDIEMKDGDDDE